MQILLVGSKIIWLCNKMGQT